MNAFAEMLLAARTQSPHVLAVTDTRGGLTHAELVAAARAEAARIRGDARRPSPVVAICLPLSTDCLVSLVAAILGNYSICFLDPAVDPDRHAAVLAALRPDVTVTVRGLRRSAGQDATAVAIAEPGYVARSSGSTGGAPKGVLASWAAIAAFVPAGAQALELDRDAAWAEVSHPAYDMAMTNLLVALASGAAIHLSGALSDQLRPLRFIERVAATHVRLAPRFIELASAERRPPDGLPLRVWGSGGDRLHIAHVDQAFALGVPTVINTYGTSETVGFASAARLIPSEEVASVGGCAPIGRGRVGRWSAGLVGTEPDRMLTISSRHLPRGYLFGAAPDYPRWEEPNTVVTGDIGAWDGDNLFCLGRTGRRVKRNGSFVELDAIDRALRDARAVLSFTVTTRSGELLSLVEGERTQTDGLRRELISSLRPESVPDGVIAVPRLPRLANGKVDQSAAAALAESLSSRGEG
ncbi:AMP-binding protein [Microbacterium cremeum]|uniref:AMP-binding protein n=1 Tax=Microbacterium cremeum TaxID=2782169 RepID=UPI001887A45C|nr:AMP-binding protein [Microbacterium cremeum]